MTRTTAPEADARSTASLASPAKLNLFLEVTEKRPDGYHDIDSVFLEIDVADFLTARLTANVGDLSLACNQADIPVDDGNLAMQAVRLLAREAGGTLPSLEFRLVKRIPIGGGLGGGSSNAAVALRLANRLWRTGFSDAELEELGAHIGSDVPFFFRGGLCRCRGRGEVVERLASPPAAVRICLAISNLHSATAAAFRCLRLPEPREVRKADAFIQALASGEAEAMAAAAFNRFDASVLSAIPPLAAVRDRLARELSHGPWLSGSGSTLWFFGTATEMAGRLAGDPEWTSLSRRCGIRLLDATANFPARIHG